MHKYVSDEVLKKYSTKGYITHMSQENCMIYEVEANALKTVAEAYS